ncbi:hypothetical protein SCOCK_210012 [Actinacidiphila cocklensis]|uniref:Uncharacterized protein n=1 Tax=Actinacidiphila cocklensis TaxID=887465 RepID=A0A9W4GQN1_9ACTN|nr:hypothetical protein SCOCK_210012 [Actinacidiphila cocklensis]
MSLAGARVLARWCPAQRWRDLDLPLSCGTWDGVSRHSPSPEKELGERGFPKRLKREGVSTVAGRAGGPARSSDDPPA